MKTLWYYISYPIRLILRERVSKYKAKLEELERKQFYYRPKARRRGMTYFLAWDQFTGMILADRYKRFIKRWSI